LAPIPNIISEASLAESSVDIFENFMEKIIDVRK